MEANVEQCRPATWGGVLVGLVIATLALGGCGDLFGPATQYGAVTVLVRDTAGAPATGVALTLYNGERHMGYGTTDAAGSHTFSFVPEGGYGVWATPPVGWTVAEGESNFVVFDLAEGETREVRIVLATP
jgi:hypothetical protein